MTNPKIRVHDSETNEVIDRVMTDVELAQNDEIKENVKKEKAEREAKLKQKTEIAERFGLTLDELKLLLG